MKHGIFLFTAEELRVVENLIIEKEGRFLIKCQIRDKYKVAKPEEVVRQLWIYRLITEYGYLKERLDVERIIYFGFRVEPGAADIVKSLKTPIRRLAAKNLALPCSRELEAQLLSHVKDVVTIMT